MLLKKYLVKNVKDKVYGLQKMYLVIIHELFLAHVQIVMELEKFVWNNRYFTL